MPGLPVVTDASSSPSADGDASSGAPRGRLPAYSLRVSVTESCPYHCPYCMPGSVASPTEAERRLSAADYLRLGRLFRARGVSKVRLTGGEPLLRTDLADIVAAWREAIPRADLALTTNGQLLLPALPALRAAGLTRVTIHIDSLEDGRYRALMGKSAPADILAAAREAKRALDEVKLNVVVQRGKNDDEIDAFLALSRAEGIEVRFIELMNTGSADAYTREVFVPGREIVSRAHGTPVPRRVASDPASLFRNPDGVLFGVIASDTEPFCDACDRLRLTADGRVRGCLYQSGGIPLGRALKSGASDETLAALLDSALDDKRSFHPLTQPKRAPFSMADVGG